MKSNIKRTAIAAIFLLIGLFAGWIIFGSKDKNAQNAMQQESAKHEHDDETVWTCSMHPQIRQNEPGLCPICAMELIPVDEGSGASEMQFEMSENAVKLANIQTSPVSYRDPVKELFLQGKVKVDERNIALVTARFGGRIEKLYVDFTGAEVKTGERLAAIYSPELITAQKELLEARKFKESNPLLYEAARNKLKLWNLSSGQLDAIESRGEPLEVVDIVSPIEGTVIERAATLGEYVKEGTTLFQVAKLDKVWVLLDAYESDIVWLDKYDKVKFSVSSVPGKEFEGRIAFIDPVINSETRAASVRVELNNPGKLLKPGMFVNGTVKAELPKEDTLRLTVPESAVMWTGKRSVVYVKVPGTEKPVFEFREVVLGPELEDSYIIEQGLNAGEEVVTHGTFKVDAAAQLAGKKSMMNREGGKAPMLHDHGSPDGSQERGDGGHGNHEQQAGIKETEFKVFGNCVMCKQRIEDALTGIPGVVDAEWDVDSKMARVKFDAEKTEEMEMQKKVAEAGHETEEVKANKKAYEDLPVCCQYGGKENE